MTESEVLELAKKHNGYFGLGYVSSGAVFQVKDLVSYTNAAIAQATQELQNRVRELENALERASDYMPIETPLVRSGSTQEDIKIVQDALANTIPNSAEIARLKVEIEVLDVAYGESIGDMIKERRDRLAELTKGE